MRVQVFVLLFFFFLHSGEPKLSSALFHILLSKPPPKHQSYPLRLEVSMSLTIAHVKPSARRVTQKAPRRETFETKGTGKKFFSKNQNKTQPNKPYFVTCESYSQAVFTKLTEQHSDTCSSLIPRTAASKKIKCFKPNVTAESSQNRGSPLVCLALLPPSPEVRI